VKHWIRYTVEGKTGFGTLADGQIQPHTGQLLGAHKASGKPIALADVLVEAPLVPGKIVALWNNFHALAAKLGQAIPKEPLWFIKASSSVIAPNQPIIKPASYEGKVVFEGELAVVIGKRVTCADEATAKAAIFGYTIINDVTAADILQRDPAFAQWGRAKSFDSFGPLGPVISSNFDLATARVKTVLTPPGGAPETRQDYPLADMVFAPERIVSLVSQEMTLEPGDVIACGTSVGVGTMKPGVEVTISIDGIGTLVNRYQG
jgi:2-keto-4-pentenoate hydratase/2-oxohepta-3-ene-1,7-dioic acid hydratase in catechol pathway